MHRDARTSAWAAQYIGPEEHDGLDAEDVTPRQQPPAKPSMLETMDALQANVVASAERHKRKIARRMIIGAVSLIASFIIPAGIGVLLWIVAVIVLTRGMWNVERWLGERKIAELSTDLLETDEREARDSRR